LSALEALECFVELATCLFVVVSQALAHRFECVLWDPGVRRNRANGRATNPHGVVEGLACKIERGNSVILSVSRRAPT
jgi:hypothetical protein